MPCEYICKVWTSEPEGFILNPVHQMRGLNTRFLSITPPVLSDSLKGIDRRPGACPPQPGSLTGNGDRPGRNRLPKRNLGWPEAGLRPSSVFPAMWRVNHLLQHCVAAAQTLSPAVPM